jgi:hypothetical protein
MARLIQPVLRYIKEYDSFIFQSRNWPVYHNCNNPAARGIYFCHAHSKFMVTDEEFDKHCEHASTHTLVYLCNLCGRFEEI